MEGIYLDHISAKPVDPRVVEFALPYLNEKFGNPSSLHAPGLMAKSVVEDARKKVADLINADDESTIVFTSSATDANNLAIKGTALRNINKGKVIAASAIEHISVLNPMKDLQKNGFTFNTIPVNSDGVVEIEQLKEILTEDTTIVSVMYANNEIGTIQPIGEISKIVHEKGAYLHVDATDAAGFVNIDVQGDGIDLLTLSSNNIYGPQGVGALYIKPKLKLQPVILGGGQQRGLVSGTENIFGIAGMGEAAKLIKAEMETENARLQEIRDKLIEEILKVEETYLTGHPTRRLPQHASFRFSGIEGESILLNMDMYKIQIATGSACTSRTLEASHVLLGIGLKHEEAHGSMIISLGRSNTLEQVPEVAKAVKETVDRLRKLSPL